MKRNVLAVFAVVLAIAFSAFSTRTFQDMYAYQGADFSENEVKNPNNWIKDAEPTIGVDCANGSEVACRVFVPTDIDVDNHLPSNLTLQVELVDGSDFRLTDIQDESGSILQAPIQLADR